MKPLRKSETRRFESICRLIREALHLEHKDCHYRFSNDQETQAEASCHSSRHGWYLRIVIHPRFWGLNAEQQLRDLIHEHIHVCLIPLDQKVQHAANYIHDSQRQICEEMMNDGVELVVAHLESVFYDLLKDRLQKP